MKTRTSIKPGEARNPGGMTKEQHEARVAIRDLLISPPYSDAWGAGYLKALKDGNVHVLIDYANRVGGKPKEIVELSGVKAPLVDVPDDVLIAFVTQRITG